MSDEIKKFIEKHYTVVLDKYYVPQTIFTMSPDGDIAPIEGDIPDDLYLHMAMYINGIDPDDGIEGFPNYLDSEGQA